MILDLWAATGPFKLAAPQDPLGYLQLALTIAALLALTVPAVMRRDRDEPGGMGAESGILIALIFIAPLAELLLQFRSGSTTALPGLPAEPVSTAFSIFGALPWMAAAGFLGTPQAAIVGFASGLARGGWVTGSLITPFNLALQAAITAALLANPYRQWPASWLRRPLAAAIVGGMAYAASRVGELFVLGGGEFYDRLNFTLVLAPWALLMAAAGALIAGGAGELMRRARPSYWRQPFMFRAAPGTRTLAGRMMVAILVLGSLSLLGLGLGQWLLARQSISDLVVQQMRHGAQQAGDSIPLFIQTGRATGRELALALEPEDSETGLDVQLAEQALAQTFFSELSLVAADGELLAATGIMGATPPFELTVALEIANDGIPLEVVLPIGLEDRAAGVAFLTPLPASEGSAGTSVLVGWTNLSEHALLRAARLPIESPAAGEVFIVDDRGQVLMHRDSQNIFEQVELESETMDSVRLQSAPDGSRRLEYVYPVPGYSWRVVSRVPQREIDRLAIPIAARLLLVLGIAGVAFLAFVYWSSQRLTRPLREMAVAAEAITSGDLNQPVRAESDDEIGRLADSFEVMRLALRRRLDELELLRQVGSSLAAELDLTAALPPVLNGLRRIIGADVVRLSLPTRMLLQAADSARLQSGEGAGWAALDGQIRQLAFERGSFALENPARAGAILDLAAADETVGSLMAEAVVSEVGVVGALWLARSQRRPFSPEARQLVGLVASQLAVWLTNVRLYQLAETERNRLRAVLDVTPEAVLAVDAEGVVQLANPAAEVVLRSASSDAVGRAAAEAINSEAVLALLSGGEEPDDVIEIKLESGKTLTGAVRHIGHNGRGDRLCVLWDVTHYKKLDMLKSEFVSTVSHDLRAPLTLMRGYATMVSMVGAVNEQQKEFVSKILDSVDGMAELVENLLDLGRIEAGVGLELETVDPVELVEDVVNGYRPNAVNKQIGIELEAEPGESISADRTLLRQAIANLVDNAIKYTASGGTVTVRARPSATGWLFEVQDTGVGIAPADQARLFERFYRARRPESVRIRGSGLGLAIVKSIAEQHGGQVLVDSKLGSGSTFRLEVPPAPPPVTDDS